MPRLPQPAHIKRALEARENAQTKIVNEFMRKLDAYMLAHQAQAIETMFHTRGQNLGGEPQQAEMAKLLERFYVDSIEQGLHFAKQEDPTPKVKHLARAPKGRVPKDLKSINELFRNRRAFLRIMRRKDVLTAGLRKSYLKRLRERFQEIMPAVLANTITPAEARKHIETAWGATRARATTIFRTESTKYFTETQIAYFSSTPSIIGFLYDTVRDAARTDICRSRHGLIYRPNTELLRKNQSPNHYNCRAHMIPLSDTPKNRIMLADPARNPELVAVVPLPKGWRK